MFLYVSFSSCHYLLLHCYHQILWKKLHFEYFTASRTNFMLPVKGKCQCTVTCFSPSPPHFFPGNAQIHDRQSTYIIVVVLEFWIIKKLSVNENFKEQRIWNEIDLSLKSSITASKLCVQALILVNQALISQNLSLQFCGIIWRFNEKVN